MNMARIGLIATCALLISTSQAKVNVPNDNDVIKTFTTSSSLKSLNSSEELKVLVWNMYKGKNKSWEEDFKRLAQDSDILITQEMKLTGSMLDTFSSFGNFEYTTATSFFLKNQVRTGVATISSIPASKKKFLRSTNREFVVNTPKVCLLTTYPLSNGEEIMIINIHALNFVPAKTLKKQLNQITNVAMTHKGPLIWAGDFNTWSKRKQKYLRQTMKRLRLTEIKYKESEDHRLTFNKKALDFIFYRGVTLKESKVLGNVHGSDHKPLIATFLVN